MWGRQGPVGSQALLSAERIQLSRLAERENLPLKGVMRQPMKRIIALFSGLAAVFLAAGANVKW